MTKAAPHAGAGNAGGPVDAGCRCARCGYPYGGTPGACPECGASVDPADPRTIARSRRGGVLRWLAHPPGVPLALASTAAGLALAYGCSVPAMYFGSFVVGGAGIAAVAGCWGTRATASVIAVGLLGDGWMTGLRRLGGWRWWVAPGIAAVMVFLAVSGASLRLGWYARRGQLGEIAEAWRKDPLAIAGMPGAEHVETGGDGLPVHPLDLWFPGEAGRQPTRDADAGLAVRVPGTGFLFERGYYVHAPTLAADSPLRRDLHALGDGWYAGRLSDP